MKNYPIQRALLLAVLAALSGCASLSGSDAPCDPPHIQYELGNTSMDCKPKPA